MNSAAVVAEVGRPPLLRVRHQGVQVLDHGIEVEALEFLGVVERLAHRIGRRGVAVENLDVQLVRPPVAIAACPLVNGHLVWYVVHVASLSGLADFRFAGRRQSTQPIPSGKVDFNDCCDKIFL